jgi:serine/threonine-protein kinase RsbW
MGGTVTTATQAAARYSGTFHGRTDQVRRGRQAIAAYLAGCPVRDDAILIGSELLTNAVLHSRSGRDGLVILRCELNPGHVRLEVEDEGGPWRPRRRDDGRPHGLDVVAALAGPGNWGVQRTGDRSRIVWARLDLAAPGRTPGAVT